MSEENQQNSFHHKSRNFVSLGGQDYTLFLYSLPIILKNRWCLKSIYLEQRDVLDVWVQVYVYKYIIHKHCIVKFFVQKVRLSRASLVGANIHLKIIGETKKLPCLKQGTPWTTILWSSKLLEYLRFPINSGGLIVSCSYLNTKLFLFDIGTAIFSHRKITCYFLVQRSYVLPILATFFKLQSKLAILLIRQAILIQVGARKSPV